VLDGSVPDRNAGRDPAHRTRQSLVRAARDGRFAGPAHRSTRS
jgi:hypothetical protein